MGAFAFWLGLGGFVWIGVVGFVCLFFVNTWLE